MRRRLAFTTVLLLVSPVLVGTTAATAGATPASSTTAAAVRIRAGSVWTLEAGVHCQADSFTTPHSFTDAIADGTGDQGLDQGSKNLKMAWTAGTDRGAVFRGRLLRSTGRYAGTYAGSKSGTKVPAILAPATAVGCPDLTGAPAWSALIFGGSDSDTATVTGADGVTPTGNVTFWVCPRAYSPCTSTSFESVSLGAAALAGAGSSATAASSAFIPPGTGAYCFDATYAGDQIYGPVTDDAIATECFTVSVATPTITTEADSSSVAFGSGSDDVASVTGTDGVTPTGTVSFYQCGPEGSNGCGAATEVGSPAALSGSGDTATAASDVFDPTATGTYCYSAVYAGNNDYASISDDALPSDECFTVTPGAALTTAPASPTIILGSPDSDTATVAGEEGATPTGTVDFSLCPVDSGPCTTSSAGVTDLGTTSLAGSGDTATASSASFTPTAAGTYCFAADYSGDDTYPPASDNSSDSECFTVSAATTSITTEAEDDTLMFGTGTSDIATVTGVAGVTPTGTVSFYECGPEGSATCTPTTVIGSAVSLSGSGDTATATSASFTPTTAGMYCFAADYSGDGTYPPASDNSPDSDCITVTPEGSVGLGSPENSFGTGDLNLGAGSPTGLWAAVNGYCTSKENGDEFLSGYDATFNGSTWACPANGTSTPFTVANYEYNGNDGATAGYSYQIVTPTDPGGTLTQALNVDAYDPAYEPSGCAGTPDLSLGTGTAITTVYTLTYEPDPLDPTRDTQASGLALGTTSGAGGSSNQYVATSGDTATCAQWANLFVIPSGSPDGTYRLQVTTPQSPGQNSDGTNAYGLRVYEGPTFQRCSTVDTVAWYSASCPVIQGENALSVYANESGGSGNFYLAQVPASDAGGTMEVSLFDPGEGDKDIELVQPDGTPATFGWETTDDCPGSGYGPPWATAPDCAQDLGFQHLPAGPPGTLAFTDSLNVDGSVTPPAGEESTSEFNDRRVMLVFDIPPDYTAPNGGWFQIHYDSSSNVTDRTTWTVSLSGPSSETAVTSAVRASALRRDMRHATGTSLSARPKSEAYRGSSPSGSRRVGRRRHFRGVL